MTRQDDPRHVPETPRKRTDAESPVRPTLDAGRTVTYGPTDGSMRPPPPSSEDPRIGSRPGSVATRAAILQAAVLDLAEFGSLGLGRVAARAGVSRQAIHYHFGSRRGLADALRASGLAEPPDEEDRATRDRIVDAGVAVMARGVGTTALEAIAAEANVTKGAIYHHFPDRAALLRAIAGRLTFDDQLFTVIDAADGRPVRDVLLDLGRTYERAIEERAPIFRGLLGAERDDPEIVMVVVGEIIGRAAPRILAWVGERIRAGELRPVPPVVVPMLLFGPIAFRTIVGNPVVDRIRASAGEFAGEVPGDLTAASVDALCTGIVAGRRVRDEPEIPAGGVGRHAEGGRAARGGPGALPAAGRSEAPVDPTGPHDPAQGT